MEEEEGSPPAVHPPVLHLPLCGHQQAARRPRGAVDGHTGGGGLELVARHAGTAEAANGVLWRQTVGAPSAYSALQCKLHLTNSTA